MRAESAKALFVLLLSTLLRLQCDNHLHELQNYDIQLLHIKLYTLIIRVTHTMETGTGGIQNHYLLAGRTCISHAFYHIDSLRRKGQRDFARIAFGCLYEHSHGGIRFHLHLLWHGQYVHLSPLGLYRDIALLVR